MSLIAFLYSEFRRLEEELRHAGRTKEWDEKKHQYFLFLKQIFHDQK